MIKMLEDCLENKQIADEEYMRHLELLQTHDPVVLLDIFERAADKCEVNAERRLLFDAISYEIISYI